MKKKDQSNSQLSPYNKAVKQVYLKLLKHTKQLLATLEDDNLRGTFQRTEQHKVTIGVKFHELVSPVLYMTLECTDGDELSIHYGFEMMYNDGILPVTSFFVRLLYKLTDRENTEIDIERCVNVDYVITDCSTLYERIEDRPKIHTFKQIPFKPVKSKRKQDRIA